MKKAALVLFGLLAIFTYSAVLAAENDSILFITASNIIPEKKLEGINAFLPVNKLGLFTISQGYSSGHDKIQKIVFTYELVKKLSFREELALKDFLREQFNKGKQIWVIGTDVPDNFLQLWFGIERKVKTYRVSEKNFLLASGLWKDKGLPVRSNMGSPQLLSLEEILREIRDTKR